MSSKTSFSEHKIGLRLDDTSLRGRTDHVRDPLRAFRDLLLAPGAPTPPERPRTTNIPRSASEPQPTRKYDSSR